MSPAMTNDRPTPPTALEPIHVVLPMRTVSGGKARLGEALDAEEREELVLGMLLHTLTCSGAWPVCRRIHLVSPDPVLSVATSQAGVEVIVHRQRGGASTRASALASAPPASKQATSLLVLPGDLPHLSVEALDELLTAADAGVVAAVGGSARDHRALGRRRRHQRPAAAATGRHRARLRAGQLRGAPARGRGRRAPRCRS